MWKGTEKKITWMFGCRVAVGRMCWRPYTVEARHRGHYREKGRTIQESKKDCLTREEYRHSNRPDVAPKQTPTFIFMSTDTSLLGDVFGQQ